MSTVARRWLIDVLTTDSLTLRCASKGLGSSGIEAHDLGGFGSYFIRRSSALPQTRQAMPKTKNPVR